MLLTGPVLPRLRSAHSTFLSSAPSHGARRLRLRLVPSQEAWLLAWPGLPPRVFWPLGLLYSFSAASRLPFGVALSGRLVHSCPWGRPRRGRAYPESRPSHPRLYKVSAYLVPLATRLLPLEAR